MQAEWGPARLPPLPPRKVCFHQTMLLKPPVADQPKSPRFQILRFLRKCPANKLLALPFQLRKISLSYLMHANDFSIFHLLEHLPHDLTGDDTCS